MTRAQCIVERDRRILMVKHRVDGMEWWCLPGGGMEPGESASQAALRELQEECGVRGEIICQTGVWNDGCGTEMVTFLVDISSQEPHLGNDPEFLHDDQVLAEVQWLTLAQIPERDRAYLWAAGLLNLPVFQDEVSRWGNELSYPGR